MDTNQMLTDHCIDELPPQEQVMRDFMQFSSFSYLNCDLTPDGRTLVYDLGQKKDPARHMRMARLTIGCLKLPLTVKHELLEIDDLVAQSHLIIQYTGK